MKPLKDHFKSFQKARPEAPQKDYLDSVTHLLALNEFIFVPKLYFQAELLVYTTW